MSRKRENVAFTCAHCGAEVKPLTNGSYRNHCPYCLYSVHVDLKPGDRANTCLGHLKPIGIMHHSKKGLQIIHRCVTCGDIKYNKVAEDTVEPDSRDLIYKLMQEV